MLCITSSILLHPWNDFFFQSDLTTSILTGDDVTFAAELASNHDVNKVRFPYF